MKQATQVFFLTLFSLALRAQGYQIKVQYKPVESGYLYLGYYFGDKKYLQDSAILQPNGHAVFSGKEKLTGGLYILVDPAKQRFFDILIDQEQTLELNIDTAAFTLSNVKGSEENNYLEAYKTATAGFFKDYQAWQANLAAAKTKKDSASIQQKMNNAAQASQRWRDSFATIHPDSYLSVLFRLMKEPVYNIAKAKTRQDTVNAFYQYKKAYWSDLSFADERLLRTPMFEQRLNRYFENVVYRHPDSITAEVDKMLLYSRSNKNMFRFFMARFTNEYMNPKYMGLDEVFLRIFEKYYLTNQVDWLEQKDRDMVFNRAYSIMGNLVGEPAAELNLLDTLNRKMNLYSIKSPYTVLVFWDPDCSHCREEVPKIDSMYKQSWKKRGVQVVGVLVDTVRTDKSKITAVKAHWMKYIRENRLAGWVHLYQSPDMKEAEAKNNLPNFRQTYDVYQTPTIYLLDEQKRIVAKKIGPEQIDEFLKFNQSNPSKNEP